jgi:lactoylglutathione lyase
MRNVLAAAMLAAMMAASCSPADKAVETAAAAPAPATAAPPPAPPAPPVKDPLLSAVGIGVSDLDKSTKFYIDVMGMKQLTTYNLSYIREVVVGYPEGESYIVLMHWIDGSKRNYKDLPVKVVTRTKDPVALAARIKAAGYTVTREPAPSAEVNGNVVGLAKDPDGYVLELLPLRAPAGAAPAAPATTTPAPAPANSTPAPKTNG